MYFISIFTIILSTFTLLLMGSDFEQEIEQYIAPSNGILPLSPIRNSLPKEIPSGIRLLGELEELRRSGDALYKECYEEIAAQVHSYSPLQKRTDVKHKFKLDEISEEE